MSGLTKMLLKARWCKMMIEPQKISQIRATKLYEPKKINLILEKKDLDRLRIRAIELETSVNELIRCSVLSWLENNKKS